MTWLIPLAVTLTFAVWAALNQPSRGGDYGSEVDGVFRYITAVIVSLAAWLIWAVLA